jgi:ATP-dependent DNA helicase UvrD/PcrA
MTLTQLDQLNPEQRRAVITIDGPVLVLAGAGTGKTRVITSRIAHMIEEGVNPESILGMTFTNKAAREMKERLAELVSPADAEKVTLGTFHSFCVRMLRKEIRTLGFTANFTIADDADRNGLLKQALGETMFAHNNISVDAANWYISDCKNKLWSPQEASRRAVADRDAVFANIYARYQQLLENQNTIDYDDMLMYAYRILEEDGQALMKYRDRYQYLLVDEYQDTNTAQFEFLKLLTTPRNNICVVGDDDQSIYGWRGANVENILNFPMLFPGTTEIKLEQNYRSTNKILNTANCVINTNANRFSKNLWSANGEGEMINVVKLYSAEEEGRFVGDLIMEEKRKNPELSFKDFAILYRSNYLSRQIEMSLREAEVPYRVVGGQDFYNRREVKDAVAFLKLLVNPKDDQSLLRVINLPPRGLGDKAIKRLKDLRESAFMPMTELLGHEDFISGLSSAGAAGARELSGVMKKYRDTFNSPGALAAKITDYLDEVGYLKGMIRIYRDRKDAEKRAENISEFINAAAQYESRQKVPPTLQEYLENFALLEENDRTEDDDDDNCVTLTTVHAAKGLEFPFVIQIGMEKNIFPNERAIEEGSVEEERRLFYVAITRAKEKMVITCAGSRMHRGREIPQRPSPFLNRLPSEHVCLKESDDMFEAVNNEALLSDIDNMLAMLKAKKKNG